MAKTINWAATNEQAKEAMINFKKSFTEESSENKLYRDTIKKLDEKYATDCEELENQRKELNTLYNEAKKNKEIEKQSELNARRKDVTNQLGELKGNYDIATKNEKDRHSDSGKEIRKRRDSAYNLLVPVGTTGKKLDEKYEVFYKAYLEYQTSYDFSNMQETISNFLKNVGYENIADSTAYQSNVIKRFSALLGSTFKAGEVKEMKPKMFVNMFLSIFYDILVSYKVIEQEVSNTENGESTPKAK